MTTTSRSAARRPALPELRPGEAVIAPLPAGRVYRLAATESGHTVLVAGVPTRDSAAPLAVLRRLATARLTR